MVDFERKRQFAELYQRFDQTSTDLKAEGRKGYTIYLDPVLERELERKWVEVLWEATEREGVKPPLKNRDFYPAAIRAVVNGTTVEGELGL